MKKNSLEVNIYAVLEECIIRGINDGYNKHLKYNDNMRISEEQEESLKQQLEHYIMLEISEKFNFD